MSQYQLWPLTELWYNGATTESLAYTYDEAGNMLTAVNTQGADTFSYSFTYNADNAVLTVSEPFCKVEIAPPYVEVVLLVTVTGPSEFSIAPP